MGTANNVVARTGSRERHVFEARDDSPEELKIERALWISRVTRSRSQEQVYAALFWEAGSLVPFA